MAVRFLCFNAEGLLSKVFHRSLKGSSLRLTMTQDSYSKEYNYFLLRKQVTGTPAQDSVISARPTGCYITNLPLHQPSHHEAGLNFLFKADFKTHNNNDDLVVCAWNKDLQQEGPALRLKAPLHAECRALLGPCFTQIMIRRTRIGPHSSTE
ncbi:hypothetical protein BDW68DRAFT_104837 [Aspergillus falconensis]